METGKCKTCESYFHPDIENKNCIQCDRQEGEYFKEDGTCGKCGEMTVVTENKKGCKPIDCEDGEIELRETGSSAIGGEETWCEACPDYTKPNDDLTECVSPACPADAIVNKDGTCMTCPDYYTPRLPNKTECYRKVCAAAENKVLQLNG